MNELRYGIIQNNEPSLMKKELSEQQHLGTSIESQYAIIDSRDRNVARFPSSNRFQVIFDGDGTSPEANIPIKFKNVHSIVIEDYIGPLLLAETYTHTSLVIPELRDAIKGTNAILGKSFAVLVPSFGSSNTTHVNFRIRPISSVVVFNPPLASLPKLTFELYTPKGVLVNIPNDTVGNINDAFQTLCILRINTVIIERSNMTIII